MDLCLRHLRFADYAQSRWKNGRGVTREIAVAPGLEGEPPAWRVSMATISEPAGFSTFPGVDRSLAVVDGGGIELTVDGVSRVLGVGDEPARFPGDSAASALPIAGATLDLNLMVDPLRAAGMLTGACAGEHETTGGRWFVVALADGLKVRVTDGDPQVVNRLDTVTFEVGDGQHGSLALVADAEIPDGDQPEDGLPDGRVVAYLIRVSV